MSDASVKAVLINIFGGILRCDVLAQGHRRVTDLGVRVPTSSAWKARTSSSATNARDGRLDFTAADSMDEAASK
jgi:succinyl-CoA synthetase beta subunit